MTRTSVKINVPLCCSLLGVTAARAKLLTNCRFEAGASLLACTEHKCW